MTTSVRYNFDNLFFLGQFVILTFPNVHYTKDAFNKAVKWKTNNF